MSIVSVNKDLIILEFVKFFGPVESVQVVKPVRSH